MSKPMENKTEEMKNVIEDLFPGTVERIDNNLCPMCGQPIGLFKDTLSYKEWTISGLCQECQDLVFK